MEVSRRFERVMDYLGDLSSGGEKSISRFDEIDDGVVIAAEVSFALRNRIPGQEPEVYEALDVIESVWDSGYELASFDDFVTDTETVGDIVSSWHEARPDTGLTNG